MQDDRDTSDTSDTERNRIQQWARGWNDAMLARAPQQASSAYALGYLDAKPLLRTTARSV